ncbi:MAG TPA: WXG100 family type VII secretion target [Lachnospiraceae bacterium]|nr:WXG100 family type VII secretion target [Lachnospiraceae bacterium]
MSFIQVTASELRNRAEELRGLNARFKSQAETLETCEQTLKSMWEGQANDVFHSAFIRDKGQMDGFYGAIEQYVSALLVIAEKYEEAETKNTATASARSY